MLHRNTPGKESIVEKRHVAEEEAECQSCDHGRDDVLVACPRVADKGVLEQGQAARPGGQEVSRDMYSRRQCPLSEDITAKRTYPHCMMTSVKK